jgi:DNA-binding MarR family transcriptional regulator
MRLEDELKQRKFLSDRIKANVNLLFTAGWIEGKQRSALESFGITWQQFNILRILRGAGSTMTLKDISSRMIDKNSNTSRLIDKLVEKDFVQRVICSHDRRCANIDITKQGLDIIRESSIKLEKVIEDIWGDISDNEAGLINDCLDRVRQNGELESEDLKKNTNEAKG